MFKSIVLIIFLQKNTATIENKCASKYIVVFIISDQDKSQENPLLMEGSLRFSEKTFLFSFFCPLAPWFCINYAPFQVLLSVRALRVKIVWLFAYRRICFSRHSNRNRNSTFKAEGLYSLWYVENGNKQSLGLREFCSFSGSLPLLQDEQGLTWTFVCLFCCGVKDSCSPPHLHQPPTSPPHVYSAFVGEGGIQLWWRQKKDPFLI